MPLPNQTNFQWRPNDNSAQTNIRYTLEAEKWVDAVNSAQNRMPKGNFGSDIGFIGAILTIPLCLLIFILMIPIAIIREVFGYNIKIFAGDEPTGKIRTDIEKFRDEVAELHKKYPSPHVKKKKTWDELTPEEQQLVQFAKASTAKAKGDWKLDTKLHI